MNDVNPDSELSIDVQRRCQILFNLLSRRNANELNMDLLIDVIQNFLYDCRPVPKSMSNKYLNQFYERFESYIKELNDLRPNYKDFNVLKIIGQGAFGQVQLVRHRESGVLYALKILNKSQVIAQEGSISWMLERDIMAQINSRWIVKLYYAFQDNKRLYMAMEYVPGGNLFNWFGDLENPVDSDVRFYAAELSLAISELHKYNFVHRDIKPDNVLLDAKGHIRLTDFGSCVRVDPNTRKCLSSSRAVGTPDYISPEVLLSQGANINPKSGKNSLSYGCEVDWWAYGVIIYEIYYGDTPFFSDELVNTYSRIMSFKKFLDFKPDGIQSAPDDAVDFMKNLICDKEVRLGSEKSAADVKNHDFFSPKKRKWDWENIHTFPTPFVPQIESECDTSNFESVDEEETRKANSFENCKELNSKVFNGENIQFSGFTLSNMGEMFNKIVPLNDVQKNTIPVNDFTKDNVDLKENLVHANRECQKQKDLVDKLMIEKHDLETKLESERTRADEAKNITRTLQTSLSDLTSKHNLCDKKLSKVEEEKHRLCAELSQFKVAEEKHQKMEIENEALKADLLKEQGIILRATMNITDLKTDLANSEKENKRLREKISQLETAKRNINSQSEGKHINNEEMKAMQNELDQRWKDLKESREEITNMKQRLLNMENEKTKMVKHIDQLKVDLHSKESKLETEAKYSTEQNVLITSLRNEVVKLKRNADERERIENAQIKKLSNLVKQQELAKTSYEEELESQRQKFNDLIERRNNKIINLEKEIDIMTDKFDKSEELLHMEKTKCTSLVDKINDIITGKSTAAQEMIAKENEKRGLFSKKELRKVTDVIKQNKRLQRMMEENQKNYQANMDSLNTQLEDALKEKDKLENEMRKMQKNMNHYENVVLIENTGTNHNERNMLDSPVFARPPPCHSHNKYGAPNVTYSSSGRDSVASGFNIVDHRSRSSASLQPRSAQIQSFNRFSFSDTLRSFVLPNSLVEFNIRKKGKKINWEKRLIKVEGEDLVIYDENIRLSMRIPVSSILFVKATSKSEAIHAKVNDIPRMFSFGYDRLQQLMAEIAIADRLTRNASTLSSDTRSLNEECTGDGDRSKSSTTDFRKNSSTMTADMFSALSLDQTGTRRGERKNSLSKLPIFGGKKKTVVKDHDKMVEISRNPSLVVIRGHAFLPQDSLSKDSASTYYENINQPDPSDLRKSYHEDATTSTMVNSDYLNSRNSIIGSGVGGGVTTGVILTTSNYSCEFCKRCIKGKELEENNVYVCDNSTAMQLCRARSKEEQEDWVRQLHGLLESTKKSLNIESSSIISSEVSIE